MKLFYLKKRLYLEEIVSGIELALSDNYFLDDDSRHRYRTEISVSFDVGEDGKVVNFKNSVDGKNMTV